MTFYIIHGWDDIPHSNWYPWLKKELEAQGERVVVPAMPDTSHPKIDAWVEAIEKAVDTSKPIVFVGHSIGCQAILRYLAKSGVHAKGVYLVAGWLKLQNLESAEVEEIAKPWLEPFAIENVKAGKKVVLLSQNDPFVNYEEHVMAWTDLGFTVVMCGERGHFTADDGVTELPELMELLV